MSSETEPPKETTSNDEAKWRKQLQDLAMQKDNVIKTYAKQLYDLQNTIITLKNEKQALQKEKEMLQEQLNPSQLDELQAKAELMNENQKLISRIILLEKQLGITPTITAQPAPVEISFTNHRRPSVTITSPSPQSTSTVSSPTVFNTEHGPTPPSLNLTNISTFQNSGSRPNSARGNPPQPQQQLNLSQPLSQRSASRSSLKPLNLRSTPTTPPPESIHEQEDGHHSYRSDSDSHSDEDSKETADSETVEILAVELGVHRRLSQILYENDHKMDDDYTLASIELFDWMRSEDTFISSPQYFKTVTKAISNVASKREPINSFDLNVYWLSTTVGLQTLIRKKGGELQQYISSIESLFKIIYDNIMNYFMQTIGDQLVNIFCHSRSNEPTVQPQSSRNNVLSSVSKRNVNRRRNHPALIAGAIYATEVGSIVWDIDDLITFLSDLLYSVKRFHIPTKLQCKIFETMMSLININMINKLLTTSELCTSANGFQIKLVINKIEEWLDHKNVKNYVGTGRKKVRPLSEAATLLTLDKNLIFKDDSIISSICPSLNMLQIRQLVISFQPDSHTDPPSREVLNLLNQKCKHLKDPILLSEDSIKSFKLRKLIIQ